MAQAEWRSGKGLTLDSIPLLERVSKPPTLRAYSPLFTPGNCGAGGLRPAPRAFRDILKIQRYSRMWPGSSPMVLERKCTALTREDCCGICRWSGPGSVGAVWWSSALCCAPCMAAIFLPMEVFRGPPGTLPSPKAMPPRDLIQ